MRWSRTIRGNKSKQRKTSREAQRSEWGRGQNFYLEQKQQKIRLKSVVLISVDSYIIAYLWKIQNVTIKKQEFKHIVGFHSDVTKLGDVCSLRAPKTCFIFLKFAKNTQFIIVRLL